ncbi:hypothetical protein J2T14_005109 [Paenibacillus harenae]|nr:hypothetical protein [Paenibacillus harenae]
MWEAADDAVIAEPAPVPKIRAKRPLPVPPPRPKGPDASILRPNREGIIKMRGQTDKGRRWYQETDLETVTVLVREFAAVVVNPHMIRRIYSSKMFRCPSAGFTYEVLIRFKRRTNLCRDENLRFARCITLH